MGCLFRVSRLVFFEGLSLRASSGSASLVWSQRTSSDGPCGVVTALLPGFESIQNVHGSPWDCLYKAGKILSQGCFSGSVALCKCSWLTDPTLQDMWALSSGFLYMQSLRFQVGSMSRCDLPDP